ncbi:MAG TPA: hypothetical protein VKN99_07415 [Polyangia bacterium]|nr:hypothetical protein [Polyangia bacterium]
MASHPRLAPNAALALLTFLIGCGPSALGLDDTGGGDDDGKFDRASSALIMPAAIVAWQRARSWGSKHLEWHTERRWDLLDASNREWAQGKGWSRANLQEGAPGNGLEFLAMHRGMMMMLRDQFPSQAALFAGWKTAPTDPRDRNDPLPHKATTPFDDNMLQAIDRIDNQIDSFESDDDFGLFVQTAMRPTASNPKHRSDDPSAGIHNYLHVRFSDSSSPINVGDPTVNLENKRFWRLHGWIDARWSALRAARGESADEPAYKDALDQAMQGMDEVTRSAAAGPPDDVPDSLIDELLAL